MNSRIENPQLVRLRYLDFAKGFAILLFLLSHSITNDNGLQAWITSFNMPIFFIVTGLLNGRRYDKRYPNFLDFKTLVKKRLFQLGIPYIIWSVVLAVFFIILELLSHSEMKIGYYFMRIITLQGMESLWFIPVIFFAEILLVFTLMCKWTMIVIPGFAFVVSNLYCVFVGDNSFDQQLYIMLIRVCIKILIAYIFVYLGYWIAKSKILERLPVWVCLPALIIGVVLSQFNGAIGIGAVDIGNPVLFWLNSILSSLAIMVFFKALEPMKISNWLGVLETFGKYTIVVLCTNNLLIEIIRLLDSKLANNFLLNSGLLGSFILAAILAVMEFVLILLAKTRIGLLFGKRGRSI